MGDPVRFVKKEPSEWWYFTFGYGHQHEGYCVKIKGNFGEARTKMFEKYGNKWAFQYSEQEWRKIEANPNRWWAMEEILEVIE